MKVYKVIIITIKDNIDKNQKVDYFSQIFPSNKMKKQTQIIKIDLNSVINNPDLTDNMQNIISQERHRMCQCT